MTLHRIFKEHDKSERRSTKFAFDIRTPHFEIYQSLNFEGLLI